MSLFHSILHSLHKKFEQQHAYKDVVIGCVKDCVGITISNDQLVMKEGVLIFSTSPTIKMAILLKKEELKTRLIAAGLQVLSIV